jgi:ELWxxDGT repeat protein
MRQLFTTTLLLLGLMLNLNAQATLVKDINPGTAHADQTFYNAMPICVWKGKAYFAANNGSNGIELWVSDGTEAGTKMLKDINPGSAASQPNYFKEYQGKLYFAATGVAGRELWVSDGTEQGTTLFKDINPGSSSSLPAGLCVAGSTLYFTAEAYNPSTGNSEWELWKSDGTVAGTVQVVDIPSSSGGSMPDNLVALNDKICFRADGLEVGEEAYVSDGTAAGTKLLKDINKGTGNSFPSPLRVVKGKLYFSAVPESGSSREDIWVSDGTPEGTQILIPGKGLLDVVELNGKAILGVGDAVYVSDGSIANTIKLRSFYSMFAPNVKHTRYMGVAGGLAFFPAEETRFTTGEEMWVTDGTVGGTKIVADMNKGLGGANSNWITPVGNKIFYAGDYSQGVANGKELMETDGTAKGTKLLADIKTGAAGSDPGPIVQLNENTLLFMAETAASGRELWKYTFQTSTPTQEIHYTQGLLTFSPNPVGDQLQVRSLHADLGDGVLRIHNLFGQLILQQPLRALESRSIQLGALPMGVYTLSLQQGDWMQVEKLVVE